MRFHETPHGVYFDDLDAFQILHNARYILYFERTVGSLTMGGPIVVLLELRRRSQVMLTSRARRPGSPAGRGRPRRLYAGWPWTCR